MRCYFILDENLVVRGILVPGAARDVWRAIARNCHHIVLSQALADKYWRHIRRSKGRMADESGLLIVALINKMLRTSGKSIWVAPQGATRLARYVRHVNDQFLADIACELVDLHGAESCIFVTTDKNTREDFNHPEMRRLGIQGKTIEEALVVARERCDVAQR